MSKAQGIYNAQEFTEFRKALDAQRADAYKTCASSYCWKESLGHSESQKRSARRLD